jgi:hypothetical protein
MDERTMTETERRMLAAFDEVFEVEEPVPAHLVRLAQEFYTWREIDTEMLELLIDSSRDELLAVRAESLQRFMAFGSGDRGVHFECRQEGTGFVIEGSVVPSGVHEVRAHRTGSQDLIATTDSLGSFRVDGVALGRMRFTVHLAEGQTIQTPWFQLEA